MPKIDVTEQEKALLEEAIAQSIKSAQRAQKSGKTPYIQEVYKTHETVLKSLETKLLNSK